jgi:hypothetical protein
MLIVFYNTLWDAPMAMPSPDSLPGDCVMSTDRALLPSADAVVFHLPSLPVELFTGDELPRPPGQRWVAWSMECTNHYPQMADAAFMAAFDLRMTYQLDSDVPITYLPWNFSAMIRRPADGIPIAFKQRSKVIANAFISSPYDRNGRSALLKELMSLMPLDSYGSHCRTIAKSPVDDGEDFKLSTISRYKFTLAFENACAHDYVTEKFFQPLLAGSVPVVLGAPNIEEMAPGDQCYINVQDFASVAALASHLQMLANDEALYQHYQAWRHRPLRPGFLALEALQGRWAMVRLCEALLSISG